MNNQDLESLLYKIESKTDRISIQLESLIAFNSEIRKDIKELHSKIDSNHNTVIVIANAPITNIAGGNIILPIE